MLSVKFTPVISSATKSLLSRTMNKVTTSSDTKSTGRDSIESASSLDTPRMDKEMLPTRTPMLPPMDQNGRVVKTCKKNGKIVRESSALYPRWILRVGRGRSSHTDTHVTTNEAG